MKKIESEMDSYTEKDKKKKRKQQQNVSQLPTSLQTWMKLKNYSGR